VGARPGPGAAVAGWTHGHPHRGRDHAGLEGDWLNLESWAPNGGMPVKRGPAAGLEMGGLLV